jgi:polysaccharide export outer membrane protein
MSNGICGIPDTKGILGRRPTVKISLLFAVGFIAFSGLVNLKAQDPAQESKSGPSTSAAPPPSGLSSSDPSADAYLIERDDVLDVYIYDNPELSHAYTVSPTGTVTVPLLPDPIPAAGLTPGQLARAMEEAFRQSGRLRRPEIAVSVRQSPNRSVAVEGAVRAPQVVPVLWRTKLADIFLQCGGLSDDAGSTVTITRGPFALRSLALEGGVATPTLTVDLKKVMDANDPASATAVWPGDRVSVERAGVLYILGNVRNPGGYTLKTAHDELTVLRAIALAGDLTPNAKKSKAMIIRKDPKGPNGRTEIALNLQDILLGRSPDPKLHADDILFVPSSKGKQALHTLTAIPAAVVGTAAETAVIAH